MILGDLNSRVGNDNRGIINIMGKFGENGEFYYNAKRLTDFCMGNDVIINNTIFRHKGKFHSVSRGSEQEKPN